ncbi:MAG: ATP-grasp domain-containing protein [Firmicutes bacterium]|nr:ATP-grasp domain-containing protein [Bacillota bacterium]
MKIGIIFGGRSCEHDISILTGIMTVNAAAQKHKVVPIYIDGVGDWYSSKDFFSTKIFAAGTYKKGAKKVHLRPNSKYLYCDKGKKLHFLDAVIVCTHGKNGEDGCLAGLLEMSGIVYAGSGVLASAVGMDKITQKKLYDEAGINSAKFVYIEKDGVDANLYDLVQKIGELKFPLILKPSNLGSSIGIVKVNDFKELFEGLKTVFLYDEKVLIEEAFEDFIELNCAVLGGSSGQMLVSEIEEPISNGFLDFSDKYELFGGSKVDGENGASKGHMGRYLPARIEGDLRDEVFRKAKEVFRLLGCSGVARVDFLLKDEVLYVNEINTIPGSLSFYLFEFGGLNFVELVDRLIKIAIEEHERKKKLRLIFDSNVLRGSVGGKM